MADIELVIKIDTIDYKYIKSGYVVPIKMDNRIHDAIRNGTPLPKGHDRLVEARAVVKALFDKKTIDDVQTIIEAESEE